MKMKSRILYCLSMVFLLSACGAIPTLPPLDSTITIHTPQVTAVIEEITPTQKNSEPSLTPLPLDTVTPTSMPDTATPKPTETGKPSQTPDLIPTETATSLPTYTHTPEVTFTPTSVPYVIQQMNPFYLENFTHPEAGCDWLGVAGQIFDNHGQVQTDVVIRAGGTIGGNPVVEDMTMPLADPDVDLAYGPGGFEITLAEAAVETDSEAWIQLYNLVGDPLSEKVMLITYQDCLKNLILMNFSQD